MTSQERMKALLKKSGIPAKDINCYGSQVMITVISQHTARRWEHLLSRFAGIVRPAYRGVDDNIIDDDNRFAKASHDVWRVWATL